MSKFMLKHTAFKGNARYFTKTAGVVKNVFPEKTDGCIAICKTKCGYRGIVTIRYNNVYRNGRTGSISGTVLFFEYSNFGWIKCIATAGYLSLGDDDTTWFVA